MNFILGICFCLVVQLIISWLTTPKVKSLYRLSELKAGDRIEFHFGRSSERGTILFHSKVAEFFIVRVDGIGNKKFKYDDYYFEGYTY